MSNRLSISQATRAGECMKSWEYWYLQGLRPQAQSAALLFGSALDAALSALVMGQSQEEVWGTFEKMWRVQNVNGKATNLPKCTEIVYAESDFDEDLLTEADRSTIKDVYKLEDLSAEIKKVYEEKEYFGFAGLPPERKEFLNFINWHCLYRKAGFMLQAVREEVLPNIEHVYSVQEKITLDNGQDSIIGFIDLVAKWKGIEKPVVLDWKSSTKEYDKDAVLVSPQLSLYMHAVSEKYENTRFAGYIVLHKKIAKNKTKICSKCGNDGTGKTHKTCDAEHSGVRCKGDWNVTVSPKARTQVLIDEIPVQTEDIVLDNMDYINQAIKNGVFHRNFNACIKAWGKCPFYNKCYKGSDEGLIQAESKRDEDLPLASNG